MRQLFWPLLLLYEFAVNMSNDMVLPAFAAIEHDLATDYGLVQSTITSWLAGLFASQLFLGPLSDKIGRRPVLFWGGILFLGATAWCALAPSIGLLIAARFFQGVGVASMMIAGYATVHELYEEIPTIRILAWLGSGAIVAQMVGPLTGALILHWADWRVIFWTIFGASALCLGLLWQSMPEPKLASPHRKWGITYWHLAKTPRFLLGSLAVGLLYGGLIVWLSSSPLLLHTNTGRFALLQVPILIAYLIGALVLKRRLPRPIPVGLTITATCGFIMVVASHFAPDGAWALVVPMTGYALGMGTTSAALHRQTLTSTDEPKGAAMAFFYLIVAGAGLIGSIEVSAVDDTVSLVSGTIFAAAVLASLSFFAIKKQTA